MLIISRTDGSVTGEFSQEDRDKLWEYFVTMFGPGILQKIAESKKEACHG